MENATVLLTFVIEGERARPRDMYFCASTDESRRAVEAWWRTLVGVEAHRPARAKGAPSSVRVAGLRGLELGGNY